MMTQHGHYQGDVQLSEGLRLALWVAEQPGGMCVFVHKDLHSANVDQREIRPDMHTQKTCHQDGHMHQQIIPWPAASHALHKQAGAYLLQLSAAQLQPSYSQGTLFSINHRHCDPCSAACSAANADPGVCSRASGVPTSTTRPASITATMSHPITVLILCATCHAQAAFMRWRS